MTKSLTYKKLLQLTEHVMARDMAELAARNRELQSLQSGHQSLHDTAQREAPSLGVIDPGALAAYGKWTGWAEQQHHRLDRETERTASGRDKARSALQRSFGQTRALSDLHTDALKDEKAMRTARAERQGLPPTD